MTLSRFDDAITYSYRPWNTPSMLKEQQEIQKPHLIRVSLGCEQKMLELTKLTSINPQSTILHRYSNREFNEFGKI